jgi:hypothetical protein
MAESLTFFLEGYQKIGLQGMLLICSMFCLCIAFFKGGGIRIMFKLGKLVIALKFFGKS